jgi:hypothetical protein
MIHQESYNLIYIINMDETNSTIFIPRANHHEMGYMENIVYRSSNTTKPLHRRSNKRITSSSSYCRFHDVALGS